MIEVPRRAEYMTVYERTTAAVTEVRATHWKGPGDAEQLTVQDAVFSEHERPAVAYGVQGSFSSTAAGWPPLRQTRQARQRCRKKTCTFTAGGMYHT